MRLTEAEYEVLKQLNFTKKQIAKRRVVAESTIRTQVHSLCKKFKTSSKINVILKALKMKIVNLEDFITED